MQEALLLFLLGSLPFFFLLQDSPDSFVFRFKI